MVHNASMNYMCNQMKNHSLNAKSVYAMQQYHSVPTLVAKYVQWFVFDFNLSRDHIKLKCDVYFYG